jgi:hypothetical protein
MNIFHEHNEKVDREIVYFNLDGGEEKAIVVALSRLTRKADEMTEFELKEHKELIVSFVFRGHSLTIPQFQIIRALTSRHRVTCCLAIPNPDKKEDIAATRDQFGKRPAARRVGLMELELKGKKYRRAETVDISATMLPAGTRAKRSSKDDITLQWIRDYCESVIDDTPAVLEDLDGAIKKMQKAILKSLKKSAIEPVQNDIIQLQSQMASARYKIEAFRDGVRNPVHDLVQENKEQARRIRKMEAEMTSFKKEIYALLNQESSQRATREHHREVNSSDHELREVPNDHVKQRASSKQKEADEAPPAEKLTMLSDMRIKARKKEGAQAVDAPFDEDRRKNMKRASAMLRANLGRP